MALTSIGNNLHKDNFEYSSFFWPKRMEDTKAFLHLQMPIISMR